MSSNLTDLILAGAFLIYFTTYIAFMALPFLATAITAYPIFLITSRGRDYTSHSIDFQEEESAIEASSVLSNKWGTTLGFVMLAAVLGVLVGTRVQEVSDWEVASPPAVIIGPGHRVRLEHIPFNHSARFNWDRTNDCDVPGGCYRGHSTTTGVSKRGRILEAPHSKLYRFWVFYRNDPVEKVKGELG